MVKKTTSRKTARKNEAKPAPASKKSSHLSSRRKSTFQKMLSAEGWKRLMIGAKK